MPIAEIIGTTITKELSKAIAGSFASAIINYGGIDSFEGTIASLPDRLFTHYTEMINWSSIIPFYKIASPKSVTDESIELDISTNILKFSINEPDSLVDENELITSDKNFLILGSPGSGKTTTIKRIIIKYFSDFNGPNNYVYSYPLLIRLRDLKSSDTLYTYICDLLNIEYKIEVIKRTAPKEDKEVVKIGELFADSFLPKLLSKTKALLILDGYDELNHVIKSQVSEEIQELGMRLFDSKIILTSRTGEIHQIFGNFNLCEIQPLKGNQISSIASKSIGDYHYKFIQELKNKPYKDLANRPLFLTFLLILFNKYKVIPAMPSEVYSEATKLLIKEWDEQRYIVRKSKYDEFSPTKKFKFLCDIAFNLTYDIKTTLFSTTQLKDVYRKIYSKYDLPEDEMDLVVREIESHNGIIAEASNNNYEFSHLSLQEYLSAEYILTLPPTKYTLNYFREYPAPIAIAVSLSFDSSHWFSYFILNENTQKEFNYISITSFLTRLMVEKPRFTPNDELGYATLALFFNVEKEIMYKNEAEKKSINNVLLEFYHYPSIESSLKLCLKHYSHVETNNETTELLAKDIKLSGKYFAPPFTGSLNNIFIELLSKHPDFSFYNR